MSITERPSDSRLGFEPVVRETLSAQIREQLLHRITDGTLAPGDRVPSERDLTEQFGVARTSVREAMQGLISMGVIERRGNRSYVVEHLPDVNFDEVDGRKEFVRQLFETRRLLELPMIGLAAERATPEQRDEIRGLAARFHSGMELEAFRTLDHMFHSVIARACGNPLLVEVHGKVMTRLFHSDEIGAMLSSDQNRDAVDRIVAEATQQHAALAQAIAGGDAADAIARGTEHLAAVERGMIDRLV
jgi:GntR family transcriptional repressor for pyruvate dehydrogenase complex